MSLAFTRRRDVKRRLSDRLSHFVGINVWQKRERVADLDFQVLTTASQKINGT
jgi:hypothetical protein